jgi:hypothetical protein
VEALSAIFKRFVLLFKTAIWLTIDGNETLELSCDACNKKRTSQESRDNT